MRPLAVLISFLTAALLSAQPAPLEPKEIDKVVLATMKAWKIPGAAIAMVRNDRVVYVQGYGSKDLGGTSPVTGDTLFQIASTSKAFTTTAMAMLVGEGKMAWDDPVRKHIEYFRLSDLCADANVTLRDIVSHRTGLGARDELWDNSPLTRGETIRALASVEPAGSFRSGYRYNNILFMAAGEAVSNAAGMPYEDFVRTRIFQPLQMTSTVLSDAEWERAEHATGHHYDWRTDRISLQKPIETTALGSAGAIKSTARDMGNWVRFQLAGGALDGRQLVDADALNETKTPQTVIRLANLTRDLHPDTNVMAYGMGWYVQDYRGELLVSHSGSLNGFRTRVELLPKRAAGFAVMINVDRGIALVAIRNALLDRLSGKPARDWNAYYLMVDRKADEKEDRERMERKARAIQGTQPSRPLEAYAGEYENKPYGKATVTRVNGGLTLQWLRKTLPLEHVQYDVFSAYSEWDGVDENVTFALGEDGTVKTLTIFGETFTRK
jgi:CubicO group peptidase (beta-lactamase class C family)